MIHNRSLVLSLLLLFAPNIYGAGLDPDGAAPIPAQQTPKLSDKPSACCDKKKSAALTQAPVDPQLLNDLARIRRQMGGSVLSGSSLHSDDSESSFAANLETLLGQSTGQFQNPSTVQAADQPPNLSTPRLVRTADNDDPPGTGPQFTAAQAVTTLRQQSQKLELLANQLEHLRDYRRADELRRSAKVIRELARTLDQPSQPSQPSQPMESLYVPK